MPERTQAPSISGRSRSGPRYWYVLAAQVASAVAVSLYLIVAALELVVSLDHLLTGAVLGLSGVLAVAVYPALFQDAVYVNRSGAWRPHWWRYLLVGFALIFGGYVLIPADTWSPTLVSVTIQFCLIGASALVSAAYLWHRHLAVGTP